MKLNDSKQQSQKLIDFKFSQHCMSDRSLILHYITNISNDFIDRKKLVS